MADAAQRLRAAMSERGRVVGTWCITAAPAMIEAAGLAGLDFQILDMEHGIFDRASLEACVRACDVAGCAALVRVPSGDLAAVQTALDVGAAGIVMPQVRSADDVAAVVAATRFPPLGERGYHPFTRVASYGADGRAASERPLPFTMVIVENEAAAAALPDIIGVAGLDAVYLGVYDMSLALGLDGDVTAPAVIDFVEQATAMVQGAGLRVGGMSTTLDGMRALAGTGMDLLVYSVDTLVHHRAHAEVVAAVLEGGTSS